MTAYGLKTDVRDRVLLIIAIISLVLGDGLFCLSNCLLTKFPQVESFIHKWEYLGIFQSQITVAIVFGAARCFFNNYLWKTHFFTNLTGVPNLNGKWEGALISSHINTEGKQTEIEMTLDIHQTWEKIRCISIFKESKSACDMVCIDTTTPEGTLLKFTYLNQSQNITYGMPQYVGYNELCITGNTLTGKYYTARNPQTYGRILLTRFGSAAEINQDVINTSAI